MKFVRILLFSLFLMPVVAHAATQNPDFMVAAQLLSAAKNADIQQVQAIINNGADVNFVDSTGLSIVCTALMNNDIRAAQILQMYGADASNCDRQIKNYRSKQSTGGSGGLFSGLSSAHTLTLAAAGAAVVVGGLLLFTDVFDPDNGNDNGNAGSGDRPGGDDNGGGGTQTVAFTLPYGPQLPNADSEAAGYTNALNYYSPGIEDSILAKNFALMNKGGYQGYPYQNYLLMMHGYSPMARGYFGMRTLRNQKNEPISLAGNDLGVDPVMGGRPVNVAIVSANGANAVADSSLGDRLLPWTTLNSNSTVANGASNEMVSSKYYNNVIKFGSDNQTLSDDVTVEDATLVQYTDWSGHGTAINNLSIVKGSFDDILVKTVGGKAEGYADADFVGFMPNGQMTIFRTGGGAGLVEIAALDAGQYAENTDGILTSLTLDGVALDVTWNGDALTAKNADVEYTGYMGADGNLYLGNVTDGKITAAYKLDADNKLTQIKEAKEIDYLNYNAMLQAAVWSANADDPTGGRSRPDVIANASVIAPLREKTAATLDDVLMAGDNAQSRFIGLVNDVYDRNQTDGINGANSLPGGAAVTFFELLGATSPALTVFSTGSYDAGQNWSGATLGATFENAAPLVFANLEHQFMSVVSVGLVNGTSDATDVSGWSPANKYKLSQWAVKDDQDTTYYKSRVCGIAGQGANGVDPWCFAATGYTDELAVASAAGAAGVVKSAFNYLTNEQVFALLALTADGAYLGTDSNGNAFTTETLASYLQSMYELPNDYQYRWEKGDEDYLDVFKEVFGYGLINLDRATRPGTSVYYYNGTDIVSGSGNAYWRAAANTNFRASSAFSPRSATISAPFFDVLESVDGELSLPRVWENEFAIGSADARGLYMGDVLGELRTKKDAANRTRIGNMGFTMAMSQRPYTDNLSGLDYMAFDYAAGAWDLAAGYQRYLTDGENRFSGRHNPIMALATNAITTDVTYNMGRWSFGAHAFSGAISDEGLLENDPTLAAQYMPARLGLISGAQASTAWQGDKFSFVTAVGSARESDTMLGAQTSGLLALGAGDTTYVDAKMEYRVNDWLNLSARATFARTVADASGAFILGMSDIESNAFAFGVDAGNFGLTVAAPLAVRRGDMQYAYADYDVVDDADGNFDLVVRDAHVENIDLSPVSRELRISAEYRHSFGEFTDGAVGFVYRVNPNHVSDFGDEGIFMMKMSHRIGI